MTLSVTAGVARAAATSSSAGAGTTEAANGTKHLPHRKVTTVAVIKSVSDWWLLLPMGLMAMIAVLVFFGVQENSSDKTGEQREPHSFLKATDEHGGPCDCDICREAGRWYGGGEA